MTIYNYDDNRLLDYLMNEDFNENNNLHGIKELKFFLRKWKDFYRYLYVTHDRYKKEKEKEIDTLNEKIKKLENDILHLQIKNAEYEDLINNIKNKKLSLKERIKGKITFKENDENKRI